VPHQNSERGVAYWSSHGKEKDRIIYITPDFHLIALDAQSGDLIPGFGDKGIVDLKKGLDSKVDPITAPISSISRRKCRRMGAAHCRSLSEGGLC
jgi:quinoprotein glucose dehydrogenase